jgi:hypothetical protein
MARKTQSRGKSKTNRRRRNRTIRRRRKIVGGVNVGEEIVVNFTGGRDPESDTGDPYNPKEYDIKSYYEPKLGVIYEFRYTPIQINQYNKDLDVVEVISSVYGRGFGSFPKPEGFVNGYYQITWLGNDSSHITPIAAKRLS